MLEKWFRLSRLSVARCFCLAALSSICGCQTLSGGAEALPGFRAVAAVEGVTMAEAEYLEEVGQVVTMSATDVPLGQMMRTLSMETGTSLLWAEELDQTLVSLEMEGVELPVALEFIARRLGVQLTAESGVYFLGEAMPEDRAQVPGCPANRSARATRCSRAV